MFGLILFFAGVCSPQLVFGQDFFWSIRSVDTMKYSRDISRQPDILGRIPSYVNTAAALTPTHISVATPYDEEFYPVLSTWVKQIHAKGMKVWFRGNWSSWEGWFDYAKFSDINEHHRKTEQFIINHKELFIDGDIFTPAPEPENGGIGDPRGSDEKTIQYRSFLIQSYNACMRGAKKIGVNLSCGFFSMNGDVAKDILDKQTVDQIGGVVVVDHFVKSPQKLVSDLKYIHEKYNSNVVLGEFGAPIPDIHGEMTQEQQRAYVREVFEGLTALDSWFLGVNYWTVFGGSTRVVEDNLQERSVAEEIRNFYKPSILTGVVTDEFGNRIGDGKVVTSYGYTAHTEKDGSYRIPAPPPTVFVTYTQEGFSSVTKTIGTSRDIIVQNITLPHLHVSFLDTVLLTIRGFISKFSSLFTQN
jgi:hypothetical protein